MEMKTTGKLAVEFPGGGQCLGALRARGELTRVGDIIASLAPPTRAPRLSIVRVESSEPIDFDAWAVRYLTMLLESRSHRLAASDAASDAA